ncbi:hypothetical protein, partial [Undibacterium sp. 5I1]
VCEEEKFDEDDIALQLMDVYPDVNPQDALRWLSRLRLIAPVKSKKNFYKVPESIKAALLSKSTQEAKA